VLNINAYYRVILLQTFKWRRCFFYYEIIDKINTIDKRMDLGTITKVQILYFTAVCLLGALTIDGSSGIVLFTQSLFWCRLYRGGGGGKVHYTSTKYRG